MISGGSCCHDLWVIFPLYTNAGADDEGLLDMILVVICAICKISGPGNAVHDASYRAVLRRNGVCCTNIRSHRRGPCVNGVAMCLDVGCTVKTVFATAPQPLRA
jgi:hypothetical protein